jgi:hypothetical protein
MDSRQRQLASSLFELKKQRIEKRFRKIVYCAPGGGGVLIQKQAQIIISLGTPKTPHKKT